MDKLMMYLAGAFCRRGEYDDWRDFVKLNLDNEGIAIYDPRFDSKQLCPATFSSDDINAVIGSDILLHYRTRGYEDEGGSFEQGAAYAVNHLLEEGENLSSPKKLIVYVDETRAPWPLNFSLADVFFTDLETSVEFLNLIKSNKKVDWIKEWLKIVDQDRISPSSQS